LTTQLPASIADFEAITDKDSRLAVELALGISPIRDILRRYGLSADSLKDKLRDPMFKGMVSHAKEVWSSDLSAKERIRLKAQILTEDSLLAIYSEVHQTDNALPARLDAFKQLATIADVSRPAVAKGEGGSRFTVNINLGDSQPVVIQGETDE